MKKIKLFSIMIYCTITSIVCIGNLSYSLAISDSHKTDNNDQLKYHPFLLSFVALESIIFEGEAATYNQENQRSSVPMTTESLSSASCEGGFSDGFNSTYLLKDRQTSPNGKWINEYTGYGLTGVEKLPGQGGGAFFLKPRSAASSDQTIAALVRSTGTFCNFTLDFDTKTVKQLRENSTPNTWEVGWIFFRYTDTFHFYWFYIAEDGIEFGKKDCDICTDPVDGQKFLVTKPAPTLKINQWQHWKVDVDGNHFKIYLDGLLLVDFIDTQMSSKLSSGNIAMYSEDAYVQYDNIKLVKK